MPRTIRASRRVDDEGSGFVTKSLLCAPLATAAGPIGAIELVNRRDGAPFSAEDAEMLRLIAAPTALAINNARMANELVEQQRMKREFDLARKLQKSLLPKRRRGLFPVLGVNLPAHEISGDFYDYFELADGRIGFVVGDISGKGLDAALLMVRAASLLRWAGKDGVAPDAWLARANDELCETTHDGRFVCALVGYYDREGNSVQFAGAGFPPVLTYKRGAFSEYGAGGPPLGIMAGIAYEQHEIALNGGALYAFSDGATDVRTADGSRLGSAGVRELIARHATLSPDARLRGLLSDLKHLQARRRHDAAAHREAARARRAGAARASHAGEGRVPSRRARTRCASFSISWASSPRSATGSCWRSTRRARTSSATRTAPTATAASGCASIARTMC